MGAHDIVDAARDRFGLAASIADDEHGGANPG